MKPPEKERGRPGDGRPSQDHSPDGEITAHIVDQARVFCPLGCSPHCPYLCPTKAVSV